MTPIITYTCIYLAGAAGTGLGMLAGIMQETIARDGVGPHGRRIFRQHADAVFISAALWPGLVAAGVLVGLWRLACRSVAARVLIFAASVGGALACTECEPGGILSNARLPAGCSAASCPLSGGYRCEGGACLPPYGATRADAGPP